MSEDGHGGGEGEVRIKLVADDQAAATVAKLKEGMKEVSHEAEKTSKHFALIGKIFGEDIAMKVTAFREKLSLSHEHAEKLEGAVETIGTGLEVAAGAAALVAVALGAAFYMAEKLGEAAIEAASEGMKQEKAMAGILSMQDRQEHSMRQIMEYSGRIREDLEEAGIKAGVSTAQMTEMFDTIVERGNLSSEKAKELTEQMALVGRITHGGMGALAQGFAMMEMGVVRARNPLVQLIAATGTLKGNAHAVAAALMKMTPEKQMEMAEKAIEKQAELMKKGGASGPPSLASLKTSFEGIREMALDAMGRPMLDALLPPLNSAKKYLIDHKEEIINFATEVGTHFAHFIEVASMVGSQIWSAVTENWASFKQVFDDAFGGAKSTFEYIYDNKEAFAKTFHDVATDLARVFDKIHAAMKAMSAVALAIDKATGALGGRAVGAQQKGIEDKLRGMAQKPEEFSKKDQDEISEMRQHYVDNALAMGANAREAGENFDKIYSFHADVLQRTAAIATAAAQGDITPIINAYNEARKHHNMAMQQYAAEVIAGSEDLRKNLLFSGEQLVDGGFKPLIDLVKEKNPDFAKDLKAGKEHIDNVKGGPVVNFNNNTFHIQQDFRDQDPDRVAMVFRKDLVHTAAARLSARTASPFGL